MSDETKEKLSKIKKGKPLLKNAKTVKLIKPNGEEIIVHHRIAGKCKDLGISYKALNKFRNKIVEATNRKNSPIRDFTTGWSLVDI